MSRPGNEVPYNLRKLRTVALGEYLDITLGEVRRPLYLL